MFRSALKFARLRIVITCCALCVLGSVASGGITSGTIFAFLIIILFIIHANSINDYTDKSIDDANFHNPSDRPLVTHDISLKQFWIIHFMSGMLGLSGAVFYGNGALLISMGLLIIDYIYSLKPFLISYKPIASPLLLSIAYVYFPFSLGYFSSKNPGSYPWLLSIGIYLAFVGRLLLKDFRDVKGDQKFGKMTFLLRYGARDTCVTSGFFWLLGALTIGIAAKLPIPLIVLFVFGLIQSMYLLHMLARTTNMTLQQLYITTIANLANTLIIILTIFLFGAPLVAFLGGALLLGVNLLRYNKKASQRVNFCL
jgi:4-hydroxybenzoate polyprenyltransferase